MELRGPSTNVTAMFVRTPGASGAIALFFSDELLSRSYTDSGRCSLKRKTDPKFARKNLFQTPPGAICSGRSLLINDTFFGPKGACLLHYS